MDYRSLAVSLEEEIEHIRFIFNIMDTVQLSTSLKKAQHEFLNKRVQRLERVYAKVNYKLVLEEMTNLLTEHVKTLNK